MREGNNEVGRDTRNANGQCQGATGGMNHQTKQPIKVFTALTVRKGKRFTTFTKFAREKSEDSKHYTILLSLYPYQGLLQLNRQNRKRNDTVHGLF